MPIFETIGPRGSSVILPPLGDLWISAVPENVPGEEPVGYRVFCFVNFGFYISNASLDLTFYAFCWFIGNFYKFCIIKYLYQVLSKFSIYSGLSIITTPLSLACLSIRMSLLFSRSLTIFWYLYGTLMLLYLWQALQSFDFSSLNWLSRICERFGKMFW